MTVARNGISATEEPGVRPTIGASAGGVSRCGANTDRRARTDRLASMVWVPGGAFLMGSNSFYREERPVHEECVDGFWIDAHPVTNAEFARFVAETGYTTLSERWPDPAAYPNADPGLLVPGSLVFRKPQRPVDLRDHRAWWNYVPGADWMHPEGPDSSIGGREAHPVVHVTYEDACAYAQWAGKQLPTEPEWEFAARGGLQRATYPWGNDFAPAGRMMANTWQGRFPWENLNEDGYEGTSPVDAFPANAYGLHDMVGNVWEWTSTPFTFGHVPKGQKSCCHPSGRGDDTTFRVVKGGSHLCAPNYCFRYRPAARQRESVDSSTCHIGFRCVVHGQGRHLG